MPPGLAQENSVRLEQKPVLAAQQLHSLELLSAPVMELQARIDAELKSNPLLEPGPEDEADPDESSEAAEPEVSALPEDGSFSGADRDDGDVDEDRDGFLENLEKVMEQGGSMLESSSGPDPDADSDAIRDAEARRERMFDSLADRGPSLQELLMEQLRYTDCTEDIRRAAQEIIGSIDDNGYLRTADGDIAQSAGCTLETAERARELVQTFDPPGIAARSVQESLLLQLKRKGVTDGPLVRLVQEHLDDLARNRLPQIARSLDVDMETLNDLIAQLRKLNAYPAAGFAAGAPPAPYVDPECFVVLRNGDYEVIPNRDPFPRFHISKRYLSLLDDPSASAETKNFIREKLASARNLLKDLDRRESTIMRIARLIVSAQHDFFEKGRSALRPMTQSGIADKLNLHETTVSRAVAGKYMSTPQGLIAFRDFFSGGYTGGDGEDVSAGAIRDFIRNVIADEDPAKPLSDSAVEKLLKARGLTVARRTIAKYREELGIPSSQLRRKYV